MKSTMSKENLNTTLTRIKINQKLERNKNNQKLLDSNIYNSTKMSIFLENSSMNNDDNVNENENNHSNIKSKMIQFLNLSKKIENKRISNKTKSLMYSMIEEGLIQEDKKNSYIKSPLKKLNKMKIENEVKRIYDIEKKEYYNKKIKEINNFYDEFTKKNQNLSSNHMKNLSFSSKRNENNKDNIKNIKSISQNNNISNVGLSYKAYIGVINKNKEKRNIKQIKESKLYSFSNLNSNNKEGCFLNGDGNYIKISLENMKRTFKL